MKILQRVLPLILLAGLIALYFHSRRQRTDLESSTRRLAEENSRLNDENAALKAQLDRPASGSASSPEAAAELLRLRGEVASLRRQVAQKPASRVATAPDAAVAPVVRTAFGGELQDVGNSTPERAASSLIWAVSTGNPARIAELLELPAGTAEADAPRWFQFFGRQLSNVFSGMEFTAIQSVKPNPDGTIRLNHLSRDTTTGDTRPFQFQMRLGDAGWKVVVEGGLPK